MTRVGLRHGGSQPRQCSSFDYVIARTEGCLQSLGSDWIDLMLIHWPDHNTPYGNRSRRVLDRLRPIAARHGKSAAQLAIA